MPKLFNRRTQTVLILIPGLIPLMIWLALSAFAGKFSPATSDLPACILPPDYHCESMTLIDGTATCKGQPLNVFNPPCYIDFSVTYTFTDGHEQSDSVRVFVVAPSPSPTPTPVVVPSPSPSPECVKWNKNRCVRWK